MCLYSFYPCGAKRPDDFHRDLKSPTPDIVAAGVVRCRWYEAVATRGHDPSTDIDLHIPQSGVRFPDGKEVCPYLVVRHDDYVFDEDLARIADAVLMGELSHKDRGCHDCWDLAFSNAWVGRFPSEADKMEYLYTTSRDASGSGCGGGSIGTGGGPSGLKREPADEGATWYGATASEYISMAAERAMKRPRNESPQTKNRGRARSTSSSGLFTPALSPGLSTLSKLSNSMSTEPPTPKSQAAKPTIPEAAFIMESEVIPPRPDQINKSKSEDYEIRSTSNLMNWNLRKDPLFQDKFGSSSMAAPQDDTDPATSKSAKCEKCQRTFVVWQTANGPEGSLVCFTCSDNDQKVDNGNSEAVSDAASDLVPIGGQLAHSPTPTAIPHIGTTETPRTMNPSCKASQQLKPAVPVDGRPDGELNRNVRHDTSDALSEVSVSSSSDSESSNQGTSESSPEPLSNEDETSALNNEVLKLRREIAQLHKRLASSLEENADTARREAKLLRKLSEYEVKEIEDEARADRKVKSWEPKKNGHRHRNEDDALDCTNTASYGSKRAERS